MVYDGDPFYNSPLKPTRDHIVPRSRLPKGTFIPTMVICADCNARKKDFTLSEWYWRLPSRPMRHHVDRRTKIVEWLAVNAEIAEHVKRLEAIVSKSKSGRGGKSVWLLTQELD